MNDQETVVTTPAATSLGPATPAGGGRASSRGEATRRGLNGVRVLAIIALLAALVAVVGSVAAWQRSERVVREAARRWQDAETRVTQLEQQARISADQYRDLVGRVAVQESRFGDMSEQQAQLERLYKNFAQDTLDTVLADAEVAVSIASQQLQVAGNVQAALVALQDAESSLKRADPQSVAQVQRLLARDIDRLRAVPQTDIAGLSLRLDSLMSLLGQFPMLAGPTPPGEAGEATAPPALPAGAPLLERLADSWQRSLASLKNELLTLIRVNRIDNPDAVMMAPQQQYFVRENLRLSLLSARLALLGRNDAVLHSDLAHAIDWLSRYYDTRNKAVANALAALKQIQEARISVDLPSLAETLGAIRAQRSAHEASR